jgi:hypothetical protein
MNHCGQLPYDSLSTNLIRAKDRAQWGERPAPALVY